MSEPKPAQAPRLPTIGRIVHVRIGGSDKEPVLRPAIVVNAFGTSACNVQVFMDPVNDSQGAGLLHPDLRKRFGCDHIAPHVTPTAVLMSISEGQGLGEWRWPAVA
jgi:hypothetical protein